MDFPAYVPAGARAHICRTLEGDGEGWKGIDAFLSEYRQAGAAADVLAGLEQEQACLRRFAHDVRMRDVYTELGKVFQADDQHADFLRAAWDAHMDFAPFRNRMEQAKAIAPKIAEAARELANLLEKAGEVGDGMAPSEFYSIRRLLDATDNRGHNLRIWPVVRGAITGRVPEDETTDALTDNAPLPRRVITATEENAEQVTRDNPDALVVVIMSPGNAVAHDPEQEARNILNYAWGKAPDLPALLLKVASAADAWEPKVPGAVGAAIARRQSAPAAEYIRAFAVLLRDAMPDLQWSAPVYAAMAGVADVVRNHPDDVVTADAVRKALIRFVDKSD